MQIINVAIDKIKPYSQNNKIHDEAQIKALRKSIRDYGFCKPVLITSDNVIIAGHGATQAAKEEGFTELPCIIADGWTDEKVREYRIVDNATVFMTGWNFEALELELATLPSFEPVDFGLVLANIDPLQSLVNATDNDESDTFNERLTFCVTSEEAQNIRYILYKSSGAMGIDESQQGALLNAVLNEYAASKGYM